MKHYLELLDKIITEGSLKGDRTGSGTLSDPEQDGMVEVPGGRDTYFGGVASASYLF